MITIKLLVDYHRWHLTSTSSCESIILRNPLVRTELVPIDDDVATMVKPKRLILISQYSACLSFLAIFGDSLLNICKILWTPF